MLFVGQLNIRHFNQVQLVNIPHAIRDQNLAIFHDAHHVREFVNIVNPVRNEQNGHACFFEPDEHVHGFFERHGRQFFQRLVKNQQFGAAGNLLEHIHENPVGQAQIFHERGWGDVNGIVTQKRLRALINFVSP